MQGAKVSSVVVELGFYVLQRQKKKKKNTWEMNYWYKFNTKWKYA